MKRTGWMLLGLAALVPAALAYEAGTMIGASHAASAKKATTLATNAEAEPRGDHLASAAAAPRCPAPEVDEEIVLPEVVIHGHAPRPKHVVLPMPDPGKVARLYASSLDDFELDGLTLTDPSSEPAAATPAVSIADDLPALRPGTFALAEHETIGDLARPELVPTQDRRLPRSAVEDVLEDRRDALEVCYGTATRVDPWLPGTAEVQFTIGKDGHVGQVATHVDGLHDSPAATCMRDVVSTLAFAPPARPIHVRADYARRARSSGT